MDLNTQQKITGKNPSFIETFKYALGITNNENPRERCKRSKTEYIKNTEIYLKKYDNISSSVSSSVSESSISEKKI